MPRTILGKVSLTPKGEYSPDTAYTALDVVNYGGSSWLALQNVTGVAPADGENWMLLAQKGDKGEQGIQGIQGIQGETGGPGPTGPQGASFTRLEKTAGTGAPGTTDTYTAYNSEGQAAGTVQVYNGMDGTGAGDFKADGTVPMTGNLQMDQHKVTGVADATEDGDAVNKGQMDAALEGVTVTTDAAPTEDSTNPVQSGGVFDALAGKADLTLSNLSNKQKALQNIGGRPGRNLLDNAYFVGGGSQQGGGQFPINQRGQTSWSSIGPVIDRWKINGIASTPTVGTATLQSGGIYLSNEDGKSLYFNQILPDSLSKELDGKTVTLSFLVSEMSGSWSIGEYGNSGATFSDAGLLTTTFTWNDSATVKRVQMWVTGNGTGSVKGIAAKLELGPTQTLAYQDEEGNWQLFETPDYGEELAKCQRYLVNVQEILWSGFSTDTTSIRLFVPLPVTMRVNPSIPNLGNVAIYNTNTAVSEVTVTINNTSLSSNGVYVSGTINKAVPNSYSPILIRSSNVLISAEL